MENILNITSLPYPYFPLTPFRILQRAFLGPFKKNTSLHSKIKSSFMVIILH